MEPHQARSSSSTWGRGQRSPLCGGGSRARRLSAGHNPGTQPHSAGGPGPRPRLVRAGFLALPRGSHLARPSKREHQARARPGGERAVPAPGPGPPLAASARGAGVVAGEDLSFRRRRVTLGASCGLCEGQPKPQHVPTSRAQGGAPAHRGPHLTLVLPLTALPPDTVTLGGAASTCARWALRLVHNSL